MELAGIRTLLLAVTTKKLTFRSSRDVWIQRNISTAAKKKKKKTRLQVCCHCLARTSLAPKANACELDLSHHSHYLLGLLQFTCLTEANAASH